MNMNRYAPLLVILASFLNSLARPVKCQLKPLRLPRIHFVISLIHNHQIYISIITSPNIID